MFGVTTTKTVSFANLFLFVRAIVTVHFALSDSKPSYD